MEKFLESLSSFNIFTNLVPGVVLVFLMRSFTSVDLFQQDILFGLVVYYFIGMLVSRVGSLILEPIFKRFGMIQFADHAAYVRSSKSDTLVQILLETANTFRSMLAVSICFITVVFFDAARLKFGFIDKQLHWIVGLGLSILFAFAWIKQSSYVKKRIEANEEQS